MRYVLDLILVEPMRSLQTSAPWVKALGPPVGAVLAFLWGEVFIFLGLLYCATALWDWVLGGQLAARRSRLAEAKGIDPALWGGFDSEVSRAGLLVKVSLLIQIGILHVGELWLSQKLGLYWTDILPSIMQGVVPETQIVILGPVLMMAATLNELRSCERNRRYLGGRPLLLLSQAMDVLDRLAERLVPPHPTEEEGGWHPLPPPRRDSASRRLKMENGEHKKKRSEEDEP